MEEWSPWETEREGHPHAQVKGLVLDWSMDNLSTIAGGTFRYRWTHPVSTCGGILLIASIFSQWNMRQEEIWRVNQTAKCSKKYNTFWDHDCAISQHGYRGFFWRHFQMFRAGMKQVQTHKTHQMRHHSNHTWKLFIHSINNSCSSTLGQALF